MKLLICTGIFPPEGGGPARYSENLARELVDRGHKINVITYSDRGHKDEYKFQVSRIKRSKFKPWNYYRYFRAVKKYGKSADIIYAQDPVSSGYPTYLASLSLGKPYILKVTGDYSWEQALNRSLSDLLIDDFQKLETYPKVIQRIRDAQIKVSHQAKFIITPSKYLKRLVVGWGVKEEKVQVVHNAVELVNFKLSKSEARERLGINAKDFYTVSVGRDVPWKGFDLLRELGVKILSGVSHEEVLLNLRAADAFVLNTGYEGFPHLVLEAMALGAPVITTRVCGNPEVVTNGENGLLVEYNNKEEIKQAMMRLKGDQALRNKLIEGGQSTVKQFSMESMIEKTESLFNNLLKKDERKT